MVILGEDSILKEESTMQNMTSTVKSRGIPKATGDTRPDMEKAAHKCIEKANESEKKK
jgi:hypothetical protein